MTRWAGSLQLTLAIGAGLVTGLAHFPDPLSVAIASLSAALLSRRIEHGTLAITFVAALAWGLGLRTHDARACAAHMPLGERTLRVRLIDPGQGTGRVQPVDEHCPGTLRARWPRGEWFEAGSIAIVRARWSPRTGVLGRHEGTLQVRQVLSATGGDHWLPRSRNAVALATRQLFGPRAGLVDALVSGRSGGIAPEIRERFAAAGLIHVLSISGFHMGMIAFWLVLVLRLCTLPSRHAELLAALAVLGYTAWLGWPPPATRAAALLAVTVLMRRRQRSVRPEALLGASALVVLAIDPWSVIDLGAWLSFSAMAGVLWASAWYRRVATPRPLGEAIAGSLGATLATAPVAAMTLGRVAAIGPVVNLVGLPLAALVVPAIGMALLTSWLLPPVAAAFAASGSVLLALLDRTAAIGAALPGAAGSSHPGWAAAMPWCALLALALHATRGGASPREAMRRAGWGMTVMVWWPLLVAPLAVQRNGGRLGVHFLDVGQGDAALLRTPAGHWIAIDAGPADQRYDAGTRVVLPFLARHGADALTLLIASHAHRDHVGGASALLDHVPVGAVLEPAEPFGDAHYLRWLEALGMGRVRWIAAARGMHWQIDGVSFRVVHPAAGWQGRGLDLNEDSVVLLVQYGAFQALFTGDAGLAAEAEWREDVGRIDLLKVGHHGSAGSTGGELLAATQPQVAVISSGTNRYGHPAPATLERLTRAGVRLWRTDQEGTVSVDTDGRTFRVRGGRTDARFDARDPLPEMPTCCTPPR